MWPMSSESVFTLFHLLGTNVNIGTNIYIFVQIIYISYIYNCIYNYIYTNIYIYKYIYIYTNIYKFIWESLKFYHVFLREGVISDILDFYSS